MQETPAWLLGPDDHWRRDRLPTPVFLGFPGGSASKESACNVGDLGSVLGLGRSPEEGNGYPLQYSGLETSMDCIAHGVAKSRTRLSDITFSFCEAAAVVPSLAILLSPIPQLIHSLHSYSTVSLRQPWLNWALSGCPSPGEGNGYPLQYSCLENPMDRGA